MSPPALPELLEQHRAELEALPGVTGTAIGLSADRATPAIHVYVTPGTDAAGIRAEAQRALEDAPMEIVEMEMPEAQPD
jgi:hypothetical protein